MKMMKYLYACCMLVLTACASDEDPVTFPPVVTTGNVSDVYREGATLYGSIENQADADITEFGIMCSDHQSMDEPQRLVVESGDMSGFKATIRNLTPGKAYYYCAYATSGYSIMKGEVRTFNTTESNPPIFSDVQCNVSYENGFSVEAHIADVGDAELVLCGFCYKEVDGTGKEPTIADNTIYVEDLNVDFSSMIEGLVPNKTYWIRAFAGNSQGIGYSETIEVSTVEATVPNISEITVEAVTASSISVSAEIWLPEGEELTEAGFYWSAETENPTADDCHKNVFEQMQGNKMSYQIEGLDSETEYYVRPYVVSKTHGPSYGKVRKVKTEAVVIPDVTPDGGSIDDLPTEEL